MQMLNQTIRVVLLLQLFSYPIYSQDVDRKINFPDVEGYKTLKCDLHIHTVFSDGMVWPTIRIEEAVKDGLDAISLTEHIEYQPWKKDIPNPDRNRAFDLAKEAAKPFDLVIIPGSEITRKMPPGHANALFIKDANKLLLNDSLEAYREARRQGAFIFWNHPNWIAQQKNAIPNLSDFHKKLIKEDLLHGIEVVNDLTYSEAALEVAKDYNLTVMGNSDIHGLVDYEFNLAHGGHRPINLVLAKEKSVEAIKEALFAGRTISWFDDILIGKETNIKLLLDASLVVNLKGFIGTSQVFEIEILNKSDARFLLKNTSVYDFYNDDGIIEIPAQGRKILQLITSNGNPNTQPLTFDIMNAVIGNKMAYKWKIDLIQ